MIAHVADVFSALRQPSRHNPPDVLGPTSITDIDDVGRTIDAAAVAHYVADASLVIASNAGFDRPVAERAWPRFADLPWACSLNRESHRALDDCVTLLHLLQLPLTLSASGFEFMQREAAEVVVRVWATASPGDRKNLLGNRDYRGASGEGRSPRAWWQDVPEPLIRAELSQLREHVYGDPGAQALLRLVPSLERFCVHADAPWRCRASAGRVADRQHGGARARRDIGGVGRRFQDSSGDTPRLRRRAR